MMTEQSLFLERIENPIQLQRCLGKKVQRIKYFERPASPAFRLFLTESKKKGPILIPVYHLRERCDIKGGQQRGRSKVATRSARFICVFFAAVSYFETLNILMFLLLRNYVYIFCGFENRYGIYIYISIYVSNFQYFLFLIFKGSLEVLTSDYTESCR